MNTQLTCFCRRQVSTKKGTYYFTPNLCSYRPRLYPQLENCNLVSLHPDQYSIVLFHFHLLLSFVVHTVMGVCVPAYLHLCFCLFFVKWPKVCSDYCFRTSGDEISGRQSETLQKKKKKKRTSSGDGTGKILVLWKYPLSPFVACSFSSYLFFHVF